MRLLLGQHPDEGGVALARFLPPFAREPPRYDLRCRAALSSTLLAGLELAREGELTLAQDAAWAPVGVRAARREAASRAEAEPGPSAPTAA